MFFMRAPRLPLPQQTHRTMSVNNIGNMSFGDLKGHFDIFNFLV